jgi:hypothetical protein
LIGYWKGNVQQAKELYFHPVKELELSPTIEGLDKYELMMVRYSQSINFTKGDDVNNVLRVAMVGLVTEVGRHLKKFERGLFIVEFKSHRLRWDIQLSATVYRL